jgi:hypothetical protein
MTYVTSISTLYITTLGITTLSIKSLTKMQLSMVVKPWHSALQVCYAVCLILAIVVSVDMMNVVAPNTVKQKSTIFVRLF